MDTSKIDPQRRLILHVDGSCRENHKNTRTQEHKNTRTQEHKNTSLGWGLVAQHDNRIIERGGAVTMSTRSSIRGYHEPVAIIHGILYAYKNGFAFRDVTLFCDDNILGYAYTYLHPGNYKQRMTSKIKERLKYLCDCCFDEATFTLMKLPLR